MCLPAVALPFIMAGAAVASTAVTIVSQAKQAKAQKAAIAQQLATNETELTAQASAETNERLREMRREQGRIKVAAGEAGLQLGGSVDQLLMDSGMQANLAAGRIADNRQSAIDNARNEASSMRSQVSTPTALGSGLQLIQAGVSGYNTGTSMKINRANAQSAAAKKAGGK